MVPGKCQLVFSGPNGCESVTVTGKPAHASTPWEGVNAIGLAIQEAARRLQQAGCSNPFVDFYDQAIHSSWRGEGLGLAGEDVSGPLTLNAGMLTLKDNFATLTLDIRYPVTWPFEKIKLILEEKAALYGVSVNVTKDMQPLYVPQDSSLVTKLMGAYRDLTGLDDNPLAIGGGTYARSMPNIVAFGPFFPDDVETAHQTNEFISIKTLLASAAIYREALRRLSS